MIPEIYNVSLPTSATIRDYDKTLQTLYEKGENGKMVTLCDNGLRRFPNDPMLLFYKGEALYLQKRLAEALTAVDQSLRQAPDHAEVLVLRGNIHDDLKMPEKALEDYAQAIKVEPKFALCYLERALAYQRLERLEDAIADLNTAIELEPEFVGARRARAEMLIDKEEYEQALADLRTARASGDSDSDLYTDMALCKSMLNYPPEEILPDAVKATSLNLINAEAWYRRGVTEADLNMTEEALQSLSRSEELEHNPSTLLERAALYEQTGKLPAAIGDLNKVIKENPESAFALSTRARILYRSGAFKQAKADILNAIKSDPEDAYSHSLHSVILTDEGNFGAALAEALTTYKLSPQTAMGILAVAEVLESFGYVDEAAEFVDTSLEAAPDDVREEIEHELALQDWNTENR